MLPIWASRLILIGLVAGWIAVPIAALLLGGGEGVGEAPPASAAPYAASVNRLIYHRRDCGHVRRIPPDRREYFPTAAAAEATGRRPCRHCLAGPSRPTGKISKRR